MLYPFYTIGLDGSDLDRFDMIDSYSMKHIRNLPQRHKKHMIELLRIMADSIESGTLSVSEQAVMTNDDPNGI